MTAPLQCFWIPGWHPAPLNKLLGHHMAAARLKAKDREQVARAALVYGLRKARVVNPPLMADAIEGCGVDISKIKRRMSLTIVAEPGKRACDPDAYSKSLLDAMVHAGLLVNDSRHWVVMEPVKYLRGTKDMWGSLVILEDMA